MTVAIALNSHMGVKMDRFLSSAQVAKRFNVTSRTVVRWINDGDLPNAFQANPTVKNSPFLVPLSSVEKFEQKRREVEPLNS